MADTLCKNCEYARYPGCDYCCKTCYESDGETHGRSCIGHKNKGYQTTNCLNLKTGAPLYDPSNTICFYKKAQPYYEFTNFYPVAIFVNNHLYATSENYYQAQKFYPDSMHIFLQIQSSSSPRDALNIAHQHERSIRKDWHSGYKNEVMKKALQEKFKQHKNLLQMLLSTKDKLLVEHTENDTYWGDGGDGSGKNMLGKILMQVRDELK